MEIIRKNIHMNRQKGKAISQMTLDDDYNVPDNKPDIEKIIQEKGTLRLDDVQTESGRIKVKGALQFQVLYQGDFGDRGLHSLSGSIPFEETVFLEQAEDGDNVQLNWNLEDLSANLINSRKLSIKTIVTFLAVSETLAEEAVAVDAEELSGQVQVKRCGTDITSIAVHKKDTYRIKDEIILPANKPNIQSIIWQEISVRGLDVRVDEGQVLLKGELLVFVIYEGEEEQGQIQWLEQSVPFHGAVTCSGCTSEMFANVETSFAHSDLEIRPDYDGEQRVLGVEAVLELSIHIYEEEHVQVVCDVYCPGKSLRLTEKPAVYERLLISNSSKCRASERMKITNENAHILQICHCSGEAKIDELQKTPEGIRAEGVLMVQILYITSDDTTPMTSLKGMLPFQHVIEVPGIQENSIFYLQPSLEQLSTTMLGSEEVEVKAAIDFRALALEPVEMSCIEGVEEEPLNPELIKSMPGFQIHVVQPGEDLWQIAKNHFTTMDQIRSWNEIPGEEVKAGQKLLLVKQVAVH